MPQRGSGKRLDKIERIGAHLATGNSVTSAAKKEQISRGYASRLANSDECRQIVADLVDARYEKVEELFDAHLAAIQSAFRARREYISEGCVVTGGKDHYARLSAGKLYLQTLAAGRPPAKEKPAEAQAQTMSLEQMEEAIRRAKEGSIQ